MSKRNGRYLLLITMISAFLSISAAVFADARSDYLLNLLRTSDAFRVRAQAALSLSTMGGESGVVDALIGALRDAHPAVRAAAASALGRAGEPRALVALRESSRDAEAGVRTAATEAIRALEATQATARGTSPVPQPGTNTVPQGPARYYVGVGRPGTKVSSINAQVLERAHSFLTKSVQQISGIVVAPIDEPSRDAERVIRERSLNGFFIDSSVVSLGPRAEGGIRAEVSIIIEDYPGRNARSFLTGAASLIGPTGQAAEQQAIEAAYTSALRNLETAFRASSSSASSSSSSGSSSGSASAGRRRRR